MILCVDCGNTSIKLGLYHEGKVQAVYAIKTIRDKTCDEYCATFKELMLDKVEIEGAIISSVVPLLTSQIRDAIAKTCHIKPLILNKTLKTKIHIRIDNPSEFGSDMLAGAIAAKAKYGYPLVIADLGTATKLYVIDKDGAIAGCVISCGMASEIEALSRNASQIMEVPIEIPKKIVGKNTIDSVQSGIIFGQAYMVSEFARRIENELGYKLGRVLTGGFAKYIEKEIVCFSHEPTLTLDGLFLIYLMNEEGQKNEK